MASHGSQELLAGDGGGPARIAAGSAHAGQRLLDQGRVPGARPAVALGTQQCRLEQHAHLGQLGRQLHLALDLLEQGAAHAAEGVAPGLDRVPVPRVAIEPDAAGPAIVVHQPHRRLAPAASRAVAALRAEQQGGVELVVTVGVDVGRDQQLVANHPLGGVAPAVELRLDPLDNDRAARADCVRPRIVSGRAAATGRRCDGRSGSTGIGGCALRRTNRA